MFSQENLTPHYRAQPNIMPIGTDEKI